MVVDGGNRGTFAVTSVAVGKGHREPSSHLERGEDGWEQGGRRRRGQSEKSFESQRHE